MLGQHINSWQSLLDALPHPVFVQDTEYNIVTANRAFIGLYGKNGDVRGMKCYQLLHGKDKPVKNCPTVRVLKTGNTERSEVHEDSNGRVLLMMTSPIIEDNSIIGIVHSFTDITELKKRERALQRTREAFLNMLEDIHESYTELEDLFIKLIKALVNALDAKSPWTRGHSERVASYAEQIAKEMGLDEDEIKNLQLAGLLHDIGKIGTYDSLLDKPEKLTAEEFEIVKKHPDQGAAILQGIKQLADVIPIIRHHHERLDGKGYPDGLKGEEIPLSARILHVADSFDSMTADRPYRPSPGREYAISELKKHSGRQFDPQVVEAFLKIID